MTSVHADRAMDGDRGCVPVARRIVCHLGATVVMVSFCGCRDQSSEVKGTDAGRQSDLGFQSHGNEELVEAFGHHRRHDENHRVGSEKRIDGRPEDRVVVTLTAGHLGVEQVIAPVESGIEIENHRNETDCDRLVNVNGRNRLFV